ncbi:MraY family glycosyltransferase [Thauera sp. GDN1]|uniref:glycosyltransferase family 4 protein n=1 Tax=Thauera sp. GDN1 TaxID=2944810 RepID=UPI0024793137|nr:MraY family glycosyltransferase [Thauera sp. GDN1]
MELYEFDKPGLAVLAGFCATLLGVRFFAKLAPQLGLLDHPGGRKLHATPTPLIGGLAMGGPLCLWMMLSEPSMLMGSLLSGFVGMLAVGLVDDRLQIRALVKLALTVGVLLLSLFGFDLHLQQLGELLPDRALQVAPWLTWPLTLFAAAALINAFNMIDGLDGLAGSVMATVLFWLAVVLATTDLPSALKMVPLVALAGLAGFLAFNLRLGRRRARVFMGDAGALALGFLIVWLTIAGTQQAGPAAPPPMVMVWIVALPMLDMVATMALRLRRRRSPMAAGRDHLHHLLCLRGMGVTRVVVVEAMASLALGAVGVLLWRVALPDWVSLLGFIGVTVTFMGLTLAAWSRLEQQVPPAHVHRPDPHRPARMARAFDALESIERRLDEHRPHGRALP